MSRCEEYRIERLVEEHGPIVEDPVDGVLYLFDDSESGEPVWFLMLCPCGCGTRLAGPLFDANPSWRLDIDPDGRPTLSPSINVNVQPGSCRSHFFLRNGSIKWC